ncbi:MAG TPA: M28 family peptidase [Verrucomicrobiae bacterium]|nr:M28 family peptidase [Verrucomicrobiae bacterium]
MKILLRFAALGAVISAATAQSPTLFDQIRERLTANGLRADVSFLASDALEGRGTPSRGLDIAGEYIAAQFRRAGLEPAGDDGYFQTAPFVTVTPNTEGVSFVYEAGGQTIKANADEISLGNGGAVDLSHAPAIKVDSTDTATMNALTADDVKDKVILLETPDQAGGGRGARGGRGGSAALRSAALLVTIRSTAQPGQIQLRDASASAPPAAMPAITVTNAAIRAAVAAAKPGPLDARISVHIAAPVTTPVKLRNVVGVLRGSDPVLKDTYVVLTGHYDHLGVRGAGPGDHIFNGANDDASGTSSVMEIANALGTLPTRPKRSIIFIALFGEERGDLGSRYYGSHPIFPLAKTIADVNLEQLGRTDETGEGQKLGQFNLTGFDFTDMPAIFRKYGELTGIKVVKDEAKSDPYFNRSDNAAFAAVGVPSTTLSVAYSYSDYHGAGDEWPKLDYDNMAKVDWTIALAFYHMADSTDEPHWNADNPKTENYRKARGK